MIISVTTTEEQDEGIDLAAKKYNAEKKAAWDAAEAQKPVGERVAYTKVTDKQYAEARVTDMLNSYVQQKTETIKEQVNSILKVATKAERAAILAAVEAVPVAAK